MESIKEKIEKLPVSERSKLLRDIIGNYGIDELGIAQNDLSLSEQRSGVESSPEGNPRKKQKTLDGWVIKKKQPSTTILANESQSTSELVNGDSLPVSENNSPCTSKAVNRDNRIISENNSPSKIKAVNRDNRVTSGNNSPSKTKAVTCNNLITSENNSPSKSKAVTRDKLITSENNSPSTSKVVNGYYPITQPANNSPSKRKAVNRDNRVTSGNNSPSTSKAVTFCENVSTPNSLHVTLDENNACAKSENTIGKVVKGQVALETSYAEAGEVTSEKYNLRPKRTRQSCRCSQDESNSRRGCINDNNRELSHKSCKRSEDLALSKVIQTPKRDKLTQPQHHSTPQQVQHTESHICKDNNTCASPNKKARYSARTKTGKSIVSNENKSNENAACDDNQSTSQLQVDQDVRTDTLLSNYEAYTKLSEEFSKIGLNIVDVVANEKIQNLLNDQKSLDNEAVVFFGTFKSATGEILPVAHQINSKTELLESLDKLKKINPTIHE